MTTVWISRAAISQWPKRKRRRSHLKLTQASRQALRREPAARPSGGGRGEHRNRRHVARLMRHFSKIGPRSASLKMQHTANSSRRASGCATWEAFDFKAHALGEIGVICDGFDRDAVTRHARVIRRKQHSRRHHPYLKSASVLFLGADAIGKIAEAASVHLLLAGERVPQTALIVIPGRRMEQEHCAGKPFGVAELRFGEHPSYPLLFPPMAPLPGQSVTAPYLNTSGSIMQPRYEPRGNAPAW